MTKINKKRVEEFIRVDHAGERGAIKIYEGQLLALNTFVKDENLKKTIEEMKIHEKEHCDFFESEIKKFSHYIKNYVLKKISIYGDQSSHDHKEDKAIILSIKVRKK